jgi:hypothetical protein
VDAPPEELAALRAHTLAVWREVKAAAHVFRCVQTLSFLQPRARLHPDTPRSWRLRALPLPLAAPSLWRTSAAPLAKTRARSSWTACPQPAASPPTCTTRIGKPACLATMIRRYRA